MIKLLTRKGLCIFEKTWILTKSIWHLLNAEFPLIPSSQQWSHDNYHGDSLLFLYLYILCMLKEVLKMWFCEECDTVCYTQCYGTCNNDCFLRCGSCDAICNDSCSYNCKDQCVKYCTNVCAQSCGSGCKVNCGYSCSGTCKHGCSSCSDECTSCTGSCDNSCSGTCAGTESIEALTPLNELFLKNEEE